MEMDVIMTAVMDHDRLSGVYARGRKNFLRLQFIEIIDKGSMLRSQGRILQYFHEHLLQFRHILLHIEKELVQDLPFISELMTAGSVPIRTRQHRQAIAVGLRDELPPRPGRDMFILG